MEAALRLTSPVQFPQFVPSAKLGMPFALPHFSPAQVPSRQSFVRMTAEPAPPHRTQEPNAARAARQSDRDRDRGRRAGSRRCENGEFGRIIPEESFENLLRKADNSGKYA
jgi:hypothetical protein